MADIIQLPLRRPMVSVETARAVLGRTEDQILDLIDDGRIRFAWDLSAEKSRRKLVRIFAPSLADLANGTDHQPNRLEDALRFLVPGTSPTIKASRLATVFGTSGSLLTKLIKERSLEKVMDGERSKDSPEVSLASAVKFLTLRRIP